MQTAGSNCASGLRPAASIFSKTRPEICASCRPSTSSRKLSGINFAQLCGTVSAQPSTLRHLHCYGAIVRPVMETVDEVLFVQGTARAGNRAVRKSNASANKGREDLAAL